MALKRPLRLGARAACSARLGAIALVAFVAVESPGLSRDASYLRLDLPILYAMMNQ
jgi:hypothetical protein